jgi:hypothetical protein
MENALLLFEPRSTRFGTECSTRLRRRFFTVKTGLEGVRPPAASFRLGAPALSDLDPESLRPRQRTSGRSGTVPHPAL